MGSDTSKPSINLASKLDQALRDRYTKEKADEAAAAAAISQKKMDAEGSPLQVNPRVAL